MSRNRISNPDDQRSGPSFVRLRLYTSGRSDYTRSVLDTLDRILSRYDGAEFVFDVREATEADESEHVFFTPMLVVEDEADPPRRTVLVGDLRNDDVVTGLLARYGLRPRVKSTTSRE
jgi:hypothetical protein